MMGTKSRMEKKKRTREQIERNREWVPNPAIKRCTTEKDVAARTARRVSTCHKMPVCEAGVTNTKTSNTSSRCRVRCVEEPHRSTVGLIKASLFPAVQRACQDSRIARVTKDKVSDGRRRLVHIATRSALSLPGSPKWDGTQQKETSLRRE